MVFNKIKMRCEKCEKNHNGTFGSGRFCSRSCANSRVHSEETKQKISRSIKKFAQSEEGIDLIKIQAAKKRKCLFPKPLPISSISLRNKRSPYVYAKKKEARYISMHQHRLLMEQCLGRKLHTDEIVHHIDGNTKNNKIKNLQVMCRSKHRSLHNKKHTEYIDINCTQCNIIIHKRKKLVEYNKKIGQKNFFCSRKCLYSYQTL